MSIVVLKNNSNKSHIFGVIIGDPLVKMNSAFLLAGTVSLDVQFAVDMEPNSFVLGKQELICGVFLCFSLPESMEERAGRKKIR